MRFTRIGPNVYQTHSRTTDMSYNLGVVDDGRVMCQCRAAVMRGVNGCAHARALIEQGLAVREGDT